MNFTLPLVIKLAGDSEDGAFTGVASSWNRDRHGDTIARGAWAASITALNAGATKVPLLENHRNDNQIGLIRSGEETDDGLLVQGQIVRGTDAADRAHQLARAGALSLSVGFLPLDGEPQADGGFLYKRADLVEVSAVAAPSNRESRILQVRSLEFSERDELEEMLREGTLPPLRNRLAARLSRVIAKALDADDDDIDPASAAALTRALEHAKHSFKTRGK